MMTVEKKKCGVVERLLDGDSGITFRGSDCANANGYGKKRRCGMMVLPASCSQLSHIYIHILGLTLFCCDFIFGKRDTYSIRCLEFHGTN